MVVDHIRNAGTYLGLGEGIAAALEYLAATDFSRLEPGTRELPGALHVITTDYETVPSDEKRWEAHHRYIDVHFVVSGSELLGYVNIGALTPVSDYDEASDCIILDGPGDFLNLTPGTFAITFPQDAHKSGITASHAGNGWGDVVRKVVVKVPV